MAATEQMCMHRSQEGICEMPMGHEGEHEYAPAPPGLEHLERVQEQVAEEAAQNVIGKDATEEEREEALEAARGPIEGLVALPASDLDALIDRAFAGFAVSDLSSADHALLARVQRAKERQA